MTKCNKCYRRKFCLESGNYRNAENCKQYKNEENLVELPCKVGDVVYYHKTLCDGKYTVVIEKDIVREFIVNKIETLAIISYLHALSCDNFGKTVFLTYEEAVKALEERECNEKT